MTFCHLNVHSKSSMLYGSANTESLVLRAKSLNQTALAMTDYQNTFNAINFYQLANKNGIKPILGATFFFCEDAAELKLQKSRQFSHLVLLAENNIGWKNINRLISLSHDDEHYYYNPRIDFKALEKYKDGIICLSGNSLDGAIPKLLYDKPAIDGREEETAAIFKAEGLTRRLLKIFDSNHLFLEVQNTGISFQSQINDNLRKIASKYGIKTIATNNVHYVDQADAASHKTLLQMNENLYNRSTFTDFTNEEYYLKPELEMSGFTEEELNLTSIIADRCNVVIDMKKRRLPKYTFLPEGKNAADYLSELANNGLSKLYKISNPIEKYEDRLKRELSDINDMGLADYFLIVNDVLSWARSQDILIGRGRGSAAGSLVSYCLGITDVDPLEYGLIWERFLNKGRGGLPDIDTDISQNHRQRVLEYIRNRFGKNNVAQLVTFSGLQARAVLKEVFRVYNMDFNEANTITSLVPAKNDEHVAISLDEAIAAVPELQDYAIKYKAWFEIARALEGCYKATGVHAAAVVISDTPFEESEYPLVRSKNGDLIFGWDMNTVDSMGLLKLDILGLATLDDVQKTIDLVNKRHNINLTRKSIPLNDQKTFDMISNGFTVGVFQIEKQLGKTWSKNLKPKSVREISDLISLIRPGPMESDMHTQYQNIKVHGETPTFIHESLGPILSNTYSSLLYQEQVIEICKQLAGMSLIDADGVRKSMGKKKPEEMKKWRDRFVAGCLKNNIDEKSANDVWDYVDRFAGYGFNLSHSISYALLSYETAYLKANYPIEFFCAKLQNADGDAEKLSALIFDAKIFGINVTPPRASKANKDFDITNTNEIAFGLNALKGIGAVAINDIPKLLEQKSFDDIIWKWSNTKTKITSAIMVALIKSGAFDDILEYRIRGLVRFRLLENLTQKECELITALRALKPEIQDWTKFVRMISDDKQSAEVKASGLKIPNSNRREILSTLIKEYEGSELFDTKNQRIVWEQFYLGISLSGSEADVYRARNKCVDLVRSGHAGTKFEIAVCVDKVREIITKKGDPMAFLTARDNTYQMDNIVVFPQVYYESKIILEAGNVIKINGKMDERGSLIANFIERLK